MKAQIIIDSRDYRKDWFIPRDLARALFEDGLLNVDVTNSNSEIVYCPADEDSWRKIQREHGPVMMRQAEHDNIVLPRILRRAT